MDTTRSSTPVEEPNNSEPSGSSEFSAVRRPTAEAPAAGGRVERMKTSLQQHAATLLQPPKKVGPAPTVWESIRAIILASYLNVLLLCIPISWIINFALPNQYTLIFVFSFLAIIPLAKLLAFATDELSMRVGQFLACLMNVTLGNAVELIVSIIALIKCEIDIVQSSLIGSILSKLLFVFGMCFFAGGLRFSEQGFGTISAQMNSSLLTISVIAVLLPGAFVMAFGSPYGQMAVDESVLNMSHGVAIILLFIYASYLLFQLPSHKCFSQDDKEEILDAALVSSPQSSPQPQVYSLTLETGMDNTADLESGQAVTSMLSEEEETVEPRMSVPVSFGLLIAVAALVAVTAEFLVDAISGLTATRIISKEFVGIILLPNARNLAEHVEHITVVSESAQLTLSLGVAVASSIQIALFVIPFIVTLGWILGKQLTLLFDPLQSIVLFLSVLTVNYTVQDSQWNWLKGIILMCLYFILCVTFWYYPGVNPVLLC